MFKQIRVVKFYCNMHCIEVTVKVFSNSLMQGAGQQESFFDKLNDSGEK